MPTTISRETQQRVLDVVRQLNYYKNVHARRLATGRSDLFGLVISEIANPYFPEIIRGFQAAAWEHGFDVLLRNTEYQPERTRSVIRKLIEREIRGVAIMTSSTDQAPTSQLTAAGVGVVFCNSRPRENSSAIFRSTTGAELPRPSSMWGIGPPPCRGHCRT